MYNDLGIFTVAELKETFRFYRKEPKNKQARTTCRWIINELRIRREIDRKLVNEYLFERSIDRFNGAGIPVEIPHNKRLRS